MDLKRLPQLQQFMPCRKGFVLVIVMVFAIITLVASAALFMGISSTYKIVGAGETDSIRGYYAAVSGARYGMILLQDPQTCNDVINAYKFNKVGITYVIDGTAYPTVYNDLMLQTPHQLSITITDNPQTASHPDEDFTIVSAYV